MFLTFLGDEKIFTLNGKWFKFLVLRDSTEIIINLLFMILKKFKL